MLFYKHVKFSCSLRPKLKLQHYLKFERLRLIFILSGVGEFNQGQFNLINLIKLI